MTTRVSSKGRIVLPSELRQEDQIEAGQQFEVQRLGRGEYRLIRREPLRIEGIVDRLLRCPEKGYFVPIDSEPADALRPIRSRGTPAPHGQFDLPNSHHK